jgi:hypothetical protein
MSITEEEKLGNFSINREKKIHLDMLAIKTVKPVLKTFTLINLQP